MLSLPGDAWVARAPDAALEPGWMALTLADGRIELTPVTTTRASDWRTVTRQTLDPSVPGARAVVETTESRDAALGLPPGALLGFRFAADSAASTPAVLPAAGSHANLLAEPLLLRVDLRHDLRLGAERWRLLADSQRRPDGALLAGSLALVAERVAPAGPRVVLVPPAGMLLARQDLLWLGRVAGEGPPDLLLRRTRLTGEVDYVLVLAGMRGTATADPDRPIRIFSSGAEQSDSVVRHVDLPAEIALPARFGKAGFTVAEAALNDALARNEAGGLPVPVFDRQLTLAGRLLRFTAEALPLWRAGEGAEASSTDDPWTGPAVLRVHHGGRSQPLLGLGPLHGSALRVQVDEIDGQPAIRITHAPTDNNRFARYWVWSESERRFVRLLQSHEQGC